MHAAPMKRPALICNFQHGLCLFRRTQQSGRGQVGRVKCADMHVHLEIAGDFGILVVIVLVVVTVANSISHGLPVLGNDLPDVGFSSIG